jgi:hypothetical protein
MNMGAPPKVIRLKPLPQDAEHWENHKISTTMLAYWLGINSRLQRDWPLPREFAERLRLATIDLDKHVEVPNQLLARALSFTAQMRYAEAGDLWRVLIREGDIVERLQRLAQERSDQKRADLVRNIKGGHSPKPKRSGKFLNQMGNFVYVNFEKKNGRVPTEPEFRTGLRKALAEHQADSDKGITKWPWKDKNGKSTPCPRSSFNDCVAQKFPKKRSRRDYLRAQ